MKEKNRYVRVLRLVNNYITFFGLCSFVLTCCMMLFISVLSYSLDVVFTAENIGDAAKITFVNVIALSTIFTAIDAMRRKIAVDRPVRMIAEATEKITKGDFTARITNVSPVGTGAGFNDIIDGFNKMAEELAGVETLRSDFISNVSHEMKTPLAVIKNYGTLLQTPNLSEEKRVEYAHGVTEAVHRLSSMITNILKLNRLENQNIYPVGVEYDLGEQICECLLGFESVWEKKGIELHTDIAEGVRVTADSELLSLVWNNLFSNAFKFTDDGGTVSVSLEAAPEYAVVRVKDTGCGMSADVGAHIFEKFYQGDTSHATQGNGLGLALVKRVVDIMQGEISVESVKGEGSTFTVKIRRATDAFAEKNP